MDLDNILTELGELGNVEHRCVVPSCETDTTSYDEPWLPSALPYKNGKLTSSCKRYKSIDNRYHENCTENIFNHNEIEKCDSFVFKNHENTITKEFNLLCEENEWKRTLIGTLHNLGLFIGMPLAGLLSDRFGRKTVITSALLCSSTLITLRSFSQNYYQFVIFEMLDAMVSAGVYAGIFILGIEVTGPKKRALGGALLSSYFSIGEVMLGIIVWLVDDWRTYLRIVAAPGFLVFSYYWIMPESIRWLITKGKGEKVSETLNQISLKNKKPMTEEIKKVVEQLRNTEIKENEDIKSSSDKEASRSPVLEVFKSKIMLLRVLNCSYCWITNAFVYYGLSLSSVAIAGNKYFNFILVSLIEIPAYIITGIVVDQFGRKLSLSMALVISGISCTMFHFFDSDMQVVRLILYLTGKGAITVSFTSLYVCASELFPTNVRHSLMGICSTLGRFGSMLAPQMPLLAAYVDPVLIYGAASFVAGSLALYFPETLNCKLPDTLEDAENTGKEMKPEII